MTDWRSTVRSQAEQVVEYHGLTAEYPHVDSLSEDPLFQELALAYDRADTAYDTACRTDEWEPSGEDDPVNDLHAASDNLLQLLRQRGAELLGGEMGVQA